MNDSTLTRRSILQVGTAGALLTVPAAGCDLLSTEPDGQSGSDRAAGPKGNEPPQLAEQVANGQLPALKERLPKTPLVLEPTQRVGRYGGEWHYTMTAGCPYCEITLAIGYQNLVIWSPNRRAFVVDEILPNVIEDFDINEQTTEYRFKLREGMKWSDGEPYTADDIMFWYEDVFSNTDLTPVLPEWLTVDGEPVVVEKIDDYSVLFRFAAPHGMFLPHLATSSGLGVGTVPAHYMRQFHANYGEDVQQQAEDANLDNWVSLFQSKANYTENPELPVLHSWVLTTEVGARQNFTAERNPYCWKVDSDGSQLPYIDRIRFTVVQDPEVMLLRATNGEIDIVPGLSDLRDKSVYADSRETGQYHFIDVLPVYMNTTPIALNLAHSNAAKRELFGNKDFRVGLSYAINRQEVIDTTLVSQGEPFQCAPRPESPFYHEELAKQYTEYDPEAANEHLDRILPDKNSDGVRLGPDGQPFTFAIDFPGDEPPDALELVRQYWQDVGIDVTIKTMTRELFFERTEANQGDAMSVWGDGGLEVMLDPRSYFPYNHFSFFALPWANWYQQGGLQGEVGPDALNESVQEPPAPAKEQMRLYDSIKATVDPDEQGKLMRQILDIAAEQFWMIGINLPVGWYGIVRNDFKNVPGEIVSSAGKSSLPYPEQYFVGRT